MTGHVVITLDTDHAIAAVITAAALVAAIGLLARLTWRYVVRPIQAVVRLVDQELTNDHGSSMKDDVHGIAVTVGKLSRDFDAVKRDLYDHLAEKEPKTP